MKTPHHCFHHRRLFSVFTATLAIVAVLAISSPLVAQTTYTYGNGTTTNQLNGNWNTTGAWYDGANWGNWVNGGVARFFSPASGGASVTITNGSDVLLGGLTKQALAANFTVIAQAGFALNFVNGATISIDGNTLATQGGAVNGTNLVVTGTTNLASTLRFGPGGGEAITNNISGLTLDTIALHLSKANDVAAVGGAVVVNSGSLLHGNTQVNRKNNQYAAGSTLTINGGTVTFYETTQTLNSLTWNGGSASFNAGAVLNLSASNALTMRGGLTLANVSVRLTNNGAQTVRFDATNNGTAIISTGTSLVLGGGVKTFNVENGTATTDMQVLVNTISETASSSIRKTGGGVVAWNVSSTTNSYSGGMTVEQGALFFVRQDALPSSGVTVSNGATLGLRMTTAAAGAFTEQQFLDLHAGTLSGVTMGATAYAGFENTGTITLSNSLTGTRGLTKLGGGNLVLTGENTYTGGTLINQGNLQVGDGGTSGSISGNVVMASAADSFRQLIFNRSDDLSYDGEISGAGSVRKEADGTLTLTGNNAYTGPTTVAAGTLAINGNQSAAIGAVAVAAGATLGGSGTIGGATTISGTLQPGNSPGVLTFNSSLTLQSTAQTIMEINGTERGTDYDGVNVVGLLTYGGNLTLSLGTIFEIGSYSFNLFDFGSTEGSFASVELDGSYSGVFDSLGEGVWGRTSGNDTWTFTQSDGVLALEVVPEPSTYALLALAAAGLGAHVVRRRTRAGR